MTAEQLRERLRRQNEVCLGNPMDHPDHEDNYPDLCADAIAALEARDREIAGLRAENDWVKQAWKDTVRSRTYELSQAKREIARLHDSISMLESLPGNEVAADIRRRYREAVELLQNVYTSGVSLDDERIRYMEVQIYRADWQDIGAFLAEEAKT